MPTFEQHYRPIQLARLLFTGRTAALFAVLTLLIAGCGSHSQSDEISALQKQIMLQSQQIDELKMELIEKAKAGSLDQQEKCATRSRKDFEDWGYINKDGADFVSHYNAALDRCFIQTQNRMPGGVFYRDLFDAYSGKQYGEYGWEENPSKKYWEVPPFSCHVTLPSGEDRSCQSDDDFQKLAAVYMGN